MQRELLICNEQVHAQQGVKFAFKNNQKHVFGMVLLVFFA